MSNTMTAHTHAHSHAHAAHDHAHHDDGTKTTLGFWIYLMSDCLIFSVLFATFGVLAGNTAGGPSGRELFDLRNVFIETMCLLLSSYTCGLGALSAERRQSQRFLIFAVQSRHLPALLVAFPAHLDNGALDRKSILAEFKRLFRRSHFAARNRFQ